MTVSQYQSSRLVYSQYENTDTLVQSQNEQHVRSQAAAFLRGVRRIGDRVVQSIRYRCGIKLWVLKDGETGELYSLKLIPAVA